MKGAAAWYLIIVFAVTGCSGSIHGRTEAPGAEKTVTTGALEAGAGILQSTPPVDALNMYLDGFHFAADDMSRHVPVKGRP